MYLNSDFDPTRFLCKEHKKRLHGLDTREKTGKRLYCWDCIRELPHQLNSIHNIEEILSYAILEEEEARLRNIANQLEQEASVTWVNDLDILLQGIIEKATDLRHMISNGYKSGFQSLSLFDYQKLFEALVKYLDTFSRENKLEEGIMLDDYLIIFKQFKAENQTMKYKKDAYFMFQNEIRSKLKNIDAIFNSMESHLKELDRELVALPNKVRMNNREVSPIRNSGGINKGTGWMEDQKKQLGQKMMQSNMSPQKSPLRNSNSPMRTGGDQNTMSGSYYGRVYPGNLNFHQVNILPSKPNLYRLELQGLKSPNGLENIPILPFQGH